jgi:hypothetical protein
MAANNLQLVEATTPTHVSRSEQWGTESGTPIIAQVVAAAELYRVYDGHESLTLTGTSQALADKPAASTHATIYAEGATVDDYARYWEDTVDAAPTASVGKKLKDHEEMACASPTTFRALNGSGTVTLRVSYYHYE